MKKRICALALMLSLPMSALAVTEGVVEAAPQVEMDSVSAAQVTVSYLPDESYYAGYGDWNPEWENAEDWVESEFDGEYYEDVEQRPRLTAGETARTQKLLAAYQSGEIAYEGESVLNKMENVIVGVYALSPEDYAGERAYVLLPGPCLTDEQILSIIDAYAQLGLTFDPTALSYRNCARGGGIETSRFLTDEERERYGRLANLIERGMLDTASVTGTQAVQPKLDRRYYCGLPDFTFRPYRAATDAELVAMLAEMGVRDMTDELDMEALEKRARDILCGRLGAALSMKLESMFYEGGYVPEVFDAQGNQDWQGEARDSYGASFSYHTQDGILVYANITFDWETNELVSASVMHSQDWDTYSGRPLTNIGHDQVVAALDDAEKILGLDGVTWHVRTGKGAQWMTDWGTCLTACAQIAQNEWITVFVGSDDGQVRGLSLDCGTLVDQLPQEPTANE